MGTARGGTTATEARKLWIEGAAGKIEAALRFSPSPRALAVLAHPHPLYGGTLHNPVIFHADRELHRAGLTTLRFNFRGVGGSEGAHDEGRGEVDDLAAAASWLRGLATRLPLVLVGYSFGSRCSILHALRDRSVAAVVAIGLPVRLWDFSGLAELRRPFAVVQGSLDEFGSPDEVRAAIAGMVPPAELRIVEGAPHLFPRRAAEAAAEVVAAVDACLAAPTRP